MFMVCASTLCLFFSASVRYELDFLPALLLLALMGIFGLERVLASSPGWRRIARWGWGLLLVYSVVINLLVSVEAHAKANFYSVNSLVLHGRADEAVEHFQKALALEPESAAFHDGLGTAYYHMNRLDEAITQYQKALEIDPDFAEAHNNLGYSLFQKGRVNEAIAHFQRALEIKPDFAEAHNNLGHSLFQSGRVNEAIAHFQRALEIKPDFAEAHNNLGHSLFQTGRVNEAIAHFQRALELKPDYAEAHNNLDYVLRQTGRVNEAIVHYQKAIELQPQFTPALADLVWILATCPKPSVRNGSNAVVLAERANRLSGDRNPQILRILAAAYAEAGRFDEAIATAQKACALASQSGDPKLLESNQELLALYRNHRPYHESPVPAPK